MTQIYVCNVQPDNEILPLPVMNFGGDEDEQSSPAADISKRKSLSDLKQQIVRAVKAKECGKEKPSLGGKEKPQQDRTRKAKSREESVSDEDNLLPPPNWHETPFLVEWDR